MTGEADRLDAVISDLERTEDAQAAWTEIRKAIGARRIGRVLAEVHVQRSVSTAELFEFGQALSRMDWPSDLKIAVVTEERDARDCRFTENVITNRCGLQTKSFTDRREAIAWLREGGA
jgi:hypothetical protein